jgi:hypothetical protein
MIFCQNTCLNIGAAAKNANTHKVAGGYPGGFSYF